MIISIGYRVKSQRGTQFRIWATSVLKEHLVQEYMLNQKRLVEKGINEATQMLSLLQNTLGDQNLVTDEGQAVLALVANYAKTWQLLWQYDEDSLPASSQKNPVAMVLELEQARAEDWPGLLAPFHKPLGGKPCIPPLKIRLLTSCILLLKITLLWMIISALVPFFSCYFSEFVSITANLIQTLWLP